MRQDSYSPRERDANAVRGAAYSISYLQVSDRRYTHCSPGMREGNSRLIAIKAGQSRTTEGTSFVTLRCESRSGSV